MLPTTLDVALQLDLPVDIYEQLFKTQQLPQDAPIFKVRSTPVLFYVQ